MSKVFEHRVGSHSDDWGGDADKRCTCQDEGSDGTVTSTPPTPNGVVSKNPIIAHPTAEKEPVMSSDGVVSDEIRAEVAQILNRVNNAWSSERSKSVDDIMDIITQQTTAALEALKPKAIRYDNTFKWTMAVPVTTINDAIWELLKEVK